MIKIRSTCGRLMFVCVCVCVMWVCEKKVPIICVCVCWSRVTATGAMVDVHCCSCHCRRHCQLTVCTCALVSTGRHPQQEQQPLPPPPAAPPLAHCSLQLQSFADRRQKRNRRLFSFFSSSLATLHLSVSLSYFGARGECFLFNQTAKQSTAEWKRGTTTFGHQQCHADDHWCALLSAVLEGAVSSFFCFVSVHQTAHRLAHR